MILNLAQRSSKVIDFGINRKRVHIFVLVVIATWTLSCTVFQIRRLKCRKSTIFPAPLLFRLKFGGVPFVPVMLGSAESEMWNYFPAVELFSQNSNLYDHDTSTSQTDRQTDRRTTCLGNTALRVASRGYEKQE